MVGMPLLLALAAVSVAPRLSRVPWETPNAHLVLWDLPLLEASSPPPILVLAPVIQLELLQSRMLQILQFRANVLLAFLVIQLQTLVNIVQWEVIRIWQEMLQHAYHAQIKWVRVQPHFSKDHFLSRIASVEAAITCTMEFVWNVKWELLVLEAT